MNLGVSVFVLFAFAVRLGRLSARITCLRELNTNNHHKQHDETSEAMMSVVVHRIHQICRFVECVDFGIFVSVLVDNNHNIGMIVNQGRSFGFGASSFGVILHALCASRMARHHASFMRTRGYLDFDVPHFVVRKHANLAATWNG